MAEGTRMTKFDERLQQNANEIKDICAALVELNGKQESQNQALQTQLASQFSSFSDQIALLTETIKSTAITTPPSDIISPPSSTPPHTLTASDHTLQTAKKFRLDFARFNGTNPYPWLHKALQFFEFNNIPPRYHVSIASYHLDDKALSWWKWFEKRHPNPTWEQFSLELETRFGDSPFLDHMAALAKLNQTTTVQDYITQFEIHSSKLPLLHDSYILSLFIAGLRSDIRREFQALEPVTICKAMGLAKLQEEKFFETQETTVKGHPPPQATKLPPLLPTPPQPPSQLPNNTTKIISNADFEKRRQQGLCFHCDEKYFRGHCCDPRPSFLMICNVNREVVPNDYVAPEKEQALEAHRERSLQAFAGD